VKQYPILVSEDAELDIAEARDRYRAVGTELEAAFRRAVDDSIAAIRTRPYTFAVVHKQMRRALLRKFPYFLLFTVFDDTVVVFGCIHMRRDPEDWKARG
jgi:toxin ParE1/3/4